MSSTSFTGFRKKFIQVARDRLFSVDLDSASDTELIVRAAMLRAYESVNKFDFLSVDAVSSIEGMTGGDLDVYMQDASNAESVERILESPASVRAVAASSAAMAAVAASSTAMAAVAASSTAMAAVIASSTAMAALYAASVKFNASSAQYWSAGLTVRSGAGLFVRLTSKAGCAGWGEGAAGNEWMVFDGQNTNYAERGSNQYDHTSAASSPRLLPRKFSASMGFRGYMAVEIAYIPLAS